MLIDWSSINISTDWCVSLKIDHFIRIWNGNKLCSHKTVSDNTFHFKFIHLYIYINEFKLNFCFFSFFMKEFIIFPFRLIPGVYGLSPSLFPSYRYDWISFRQDFFQVPRPVCFIFYSCYPFLLNLYPGYPSFQKSVFFFFFFF